MEGHMTGILGERLRDTVQKVFSFLTKHMHDVFPNMEIEHRHDFLKALNTTDWDAFDITCLVLWKEPHSILFQMNLEMWKSRILKFNSRIIV